MSFNINVDEFTTPDPVVVNCKTPLTEMKSMMQANGFRHLLVEDDNKKLVGLVSERDIASFSASQIFAELVAENVTANDLLTVSPETKLYDVALQMSENKFGSAVVVDANQTPIGIFTATDALNALVEVLRGDLDPGANATL